jgi:hypothetical protein
VEAELRVEAALSAVPSLAADVADAVRESLARECRRMEMVADLPPTARRIELEACVEAAMRRLEAAAARHDDAGAALLAASGRLDAARVATTQARELEETDAAGTTSATPGEKLLHATLRHLHGVERAAQPLMREAEALAEAVVGGAAPSLPSLLAGRAPTLLAGVESTIRSLRSVATALALASDGPGHASADAAIVLAETIAG